MTDATPQLIAFRCSCPYIAGGKEHLYHAKNSMVAAQRFVNDHGSPAQLYEVTVRVDGGMVTATITIAKSKQV